jgi:hypothetical protein
MRYLNSVTNRIAAVRCGFATRGAHCLQKILVVAGCDVSMRR